MSRVTVGNNGITRGYNVLTHRGVDIGWSNTEAHNQVIAHSDGTVVWVQTGQKNNPGSKGNASYGNAVKIKHSNGYYTLYAHLQSVKVKKGEKVKEGQVIGIMGNTGNSYGRHLHFEVRKPNDSRINPTKYIYCDLPGMSQGDLYQTYDCAKKKWLPNVKISSGDYAGNFGNAVGAVYIDNLEYRVHDKKKNKWLPWVEGRKDFAGNKSPVDGLQVKGATYRVHIKGGKWLAWVSKCDDTSSGYAGIYGKEIDAIQIKVD
jgi:hypothetical protein